MVLSRSDELKQICVTLGDDGMSSTHRHNVSNRFR